MVLINLLTPVNEEANAVPFGICHSFGNLNVLFGKLQSLAVTRNDSCSSFGL